MSYNWQLYGSEENIKRYNERWAEFFNQPKFKFKKMSSYSCVQARFLFFNGKQSYTVEFCYSLRKWYIFEEEKTTDAVFIIAASLSRRESANRQLAEGVLYKYLNDKA